MTEPQGYGWFTGVAPIYVRRGEIPSHDLEGGFDTLRLPFTNRDEKDENNIVYI